MATKQYVIFSVNDEDFGIEISHVSSIEKPQEIYQVPNTPKYIEGLINLRDKVYTVFNLRKKFSLPFEGIEETNKIIIVKYNDKSVGFIVDEVKEIMKVDDEQVEVTPEAIAGDIRKYITSVAKVDEKIIMILELSKLITSEEEVTVQY